jgi:rod shape-determining protein MreC
MLDDDRGARRRRYIPVILCIVIGIGLGVWHNAAVARGASDPITTALRTALSPAISASNAVIGWFGGTTAWLTRGKALARENRDLRRRVSELTAEVQQLREAAITAKRLEDELGFLTDTSRPRIAARVIAIEPSPHVETIIIGVGTRQGVRVGSVAVAAEGVVGHVIDAAPTSSVVLVASDPRCAMGAMVQRSGSRAIGVCRGIGRGVLRIHYLNLDADVRKGDTIITSGLGGAGSVYPKGLVIGKVSRVQDDMAASARVAYVEQAARIHRLEEVAVLR